MKSNVFGREQWDFVLLFPEESLYKTNSCLSFLLDLHKLNHSNCAVLSWELNAQNSVQAEFFPFIPSQKKPPNIKNLNLQMQEEGGVERKRNIICIMSKSKLTLLVWVFFKISDWVIEC